MTGTSYLHINITMWMLYLWNRLTEQHQYFHICILVRPHVALLPSYWHSITHTGEKPYSVNIVVNNCPAIASFTYVVKLPHFGEIHISTKSNYCGHRFWTSYFFAKIKIMIEWTTTLSNISYIYFLYLQGCCKAWIYHTHWQEPQTSPGC